MQEPLFILPCHFRLVSLMRLPGKNGRGVYNEADLYHDNAQIKVCWQSTHVDSRLKRGAYVLLRGARFNLSRQGCIPVNRIHLIDKPIPVVNPFLTVPPSWIRDREIVQRAAVLWNQLGRSLQHLFNAVMWDGGRFYRFVTGPARRSDYPWDSGRNLEHSVAVAEQAVALSRGLTDVSSPILIAAALLHDAGKADEYTLSADGYALSKRGQWVGYQQTILEWLAVARTKVVVSDAQYLALLHALIANRRSECLENRSMEATILATVDRLDGHANGNGSCASLVAV